MQTLELLEKLTKVGGVAGYEKPIADVLEKEIADLGPVRRTALGSLICEVKREAEDRPHVVLEAHMDEIGLMVCGIDQNGFLKVTRCGGIDRRVATAAPVWIHGTKGDRRGIVASEEQNPAKNPTLEQLYVDAGMTKEQAEEEFPIGTRISYIGGLKHLLEGKVSGKALDDRCGCAAMITAARSGRHGSCNRRKCVGQLYPLYFGRRQLCIKSGTENPSGRRAWGRSDGRTQSDFEPRSVGRNGSGRKRKRNPPSG